MGVSFLLCLLPALLATASAQDITCQQCSSLEDTCQTATVPVAACSVPKAAGGCIIVAEENTLEKEQPAKAFSRGCIDNLDSGLQETLTFTAGPGQYLRISTKQCKDTDNCNMGAMEAPKEETTLNKLQCPSCLAMGTGTCNANIIPCKGKETYCVDLVGTFQKVSEADSAAKPFAFQGCATPSAAAIKDKTTLNSAMYKFTFTKKNIGPAQEVQSAPRAAPRADESQSTPKPTSQSTSQSTPKPAPESTSQSTPKPTPESTSQSTPKPTPKSTPKSTVSTTNGAGPAPGKVSFTLFLPGLTGLLLVKLLS